MDALAGLVRSVLAGAWVLAVVASGFVVIWLLPLADRYVPDIGPWYEQGLRDGLVLLATLVYLGGLGPIVPKHLQDLLPSGPLWTVVTAAAIALTLLQYVALGGGQPLWSVEHVVVHVLELVGLQPSDVQGFTSLVHRHLAPPGRAAWVGSVESTRFVVSNVALVLLALATIFWTSHITRWMTEPAWTETA